MLQRRVSSLLIRSKGVQKSTSVTSMIGNMMECFEGLDDPNMARNGM